MRSPRKLADEITKIRNQGFRYGRSNGYMYANCPNPVVRSRLAGV